MDHTKRFERLFSFLLPKVAVRSGAGYVWKLFLAQVADPDTATPIRQTGIFPLNYTWKYYTG